MKYISRNTGDWRRKAGIGLGVLIALGLVLFALEKFQIINLYQRNPKTAETADQSEAPGGPGQNVIDYSPATPQDNEEINRRKEEGDLANNPPPNPTPGVATFDVSIAQASVEQRPPDGAKFFAVRTILHNITAGTCTLELSKSGQPSITQQAATIQYPTYKSCKGFDIPVSNFPVTGEWNLRLTVTDENSASKVVEQTVQVEG